MPTYVNEQNKSEYVYETHMIEEQTKITYSVDILDRKHSF